jgi:VWFA-related protein
MWNSLDCARTFARLNAPSIRSFFERAAQAADFHVQPFSAMRAAAALILTICPLSAQFRSTVPLVIAPTTVTDAKGGFVAGLSAGQLILFDNNVPQTIQVDSVVDPISLVVLVEANSSSEAVLDKLRGAGVLLADLLAADAGETAVVSFSYDATVVQNFTADSSRVTKALKGLRVQGDSCALLDGIAEALHLLATRDSSRRRIILVIAERRDRSSKVKLPDLLRDEQLQNTAVYWLTYSTFLAPFTSRPKTVWDRMSDEQKQSLDRRQPGSIKYPWPQEEEPVPAAAPPGSLFNVFPELSHKSAVDAANMLAQTTGGRTFSFLKQSALESAIHAVADEVHRQYVISFQPKWDTPGLFHTIRAAVKGRPELQVRTRAGYWRAQ